MLGWIESDDWLAMESYQAYGELYKFNQWEFFGIQSERDWKNDPYSGHGLADEGDVYVPNYCVDNPCPAHFVLNTYEEEVDPMLLNIAGVNKIIIVMPKSHSWNFSG